MRTFITTFCLIFTLWGSGQETKFDQATKAYNEGEYEQAISLYEAILASGMHSAELYFNLGNCHYKKDEIAPSIFYFEKALLLRPGDAEIQENLAFAQNMRLDAIQALPTTTLGNLYKSISSFLHYDQWAWFTVVFVVLFVLTSCLYLLSLNPKNKRVAFISAVLLLLLGIASFFMSYFTFQESQNDRPAIVFQSEIAVTSEPNQRSERVFLLHEGTKVWVEESLEDWSKIKIEDGQKGWLPSIAIKELKQTP